MAYRGGGVQVARRPSERPDGRGAIVSARSARGNVIRARARASVFPELDCVSDRLPGSVIAAVERRAVEAGVGAERVLIAGGIVQEDSYLKLLARSLRLSFEALDTLDRRACPLDDRRLVEAAKSGLLPFLIDGELVFVVAPRSVRQFMNYVAHHPRVRFRLTSTARIDRFIAEHASKALGHKAAFALDARWPQLSAAARSVRLRIALVTSVALAAAGPIALPQVGMETFTATLAAFFLAWLGLRNLGSFIGAPPVPPLATDERDLPTYAVIVALYREANAVDGLIAALREIDYPPEKLDVKIVIEADDLETAIALERVGTAPFDVVIAPGIGPRTKPKALNSALPFARGTFTVIYDAEDRPEPDQLRRAVALFRAEGADLACVQARLAIDNTADSWLSCLFTAEYGSQFDLFLPGLARMGLPLPLGGSSNHFRGIR